MLLDTGGGVVRALPKLESGPFLIHNSDSVWIEGVGSNLERLFAAWDSGTMDSLMLLASAATSLGYEGSGDFAMGTDGRLSRRGERQMVPFVFTGVSIAHPRMFARRAAGALLAQQAVGRSDRQGTAVRRAARRAVDARRHAGSADGSGKVDRE